MKRKIIVTGSSGLIGSEAVCFFDQQGWLVHGIDNNMRRDFFGADGDTTHNLHRLQKSCEQFEHHSLDIRDRSKILDFFSGQFRWTSSAGRWLMSMVQSSQNNMARSMALASSRMLPGQS